MKGARAVRSGRLTLIALLVLQLGTGGCVFHAEKVGVARAVERQEVKVSRGRGEIVLSATAHERRLQLSAFQRQTCAEHRVAHLVERTTKEVKVRGFRGGIGGGAADPRALVIVLLVAAFVLLPVGLISLLVAAARSGTTERRRVEESHRAFDCSRPMAGARALAQLPSGRVLGAFTDPSGVARFTVPEDEGEGAATLAVGDSVPVSLRFGAGVRASVPPGEGERCMPFRPGRNRCFEGLVCRDDTCVRPWRARPPSTAAASSQPTSRPVASTPAVQAHDSETPR